MRNLVCCHRSMCHWLWASYSKPLFKVIFESSLSVKPMHVYVSFSRQHCTHCSQIRDSKKYDCYGYTRGAQIEEMVWKRTTRRHGFCISAISCQCCCVTPSWIEIAFAFELSTVKSMCREPEATPAINFGYIRFKDADMPTRRASVDWAMSCEQDLWYST